MGFSRKLASVWRVLRDVDLDAIRASAEARFLVVVGADRADDARGVCTLLSGAGDASPHPWLVALSADANLPESLPRTLVGVLLSRAPTFSAPMSTLRDTLARNDTPVIAVFVNPEGGGAATPAPGEAARIVAPALDSKLARDVAAAMVGAAGPEWRLALARQLPVARPGVFAALVEETAQANAGYAMTTGLAETVPVLTLPLNLGDLVVLTKNQLIMSYRIALGAGLEGDPRRLIPEIVGVLGGGLLFRQLARQLIGAIPVLGLIPKVAVAYGGTYAIGRAVTAWATEGRALSNDALQRFSREGFERGRDVARSVLARSRRASRPPSRPVETPGAPTRLEHSEDRLG